MKGTDCVCEACVVWLLDGSKYMKIKGKKKLNKVRVMPPVDMLS